MDKKLKTMLIEELLAQHNCQPATKDILVVVRDQYPYVRDCVESVMTNTKNFRLFLWDNGSDKETADYLLDLSEWHDNVSLFRSEENLGFISPNNIMAAKTTSPFIILLNSDTEVREGWSEALIGYLQQHNRVAAVGYEGGLLNSKGVSVMVNHGTEIDFVAGWCMALPRKAYEEIGLFDLDHLHFAYCEDADFCLRAKEKGWDIYAENLALVKHHGNVTTKMVCKKKDMKVEFLANHNYLKERHADYLRNSRTLISYPEIEAAVSKEESSPEKVAETFDRWQRLYEVKTGN